MKKSKITGIIIFIFIILFFLTVGRIAYKTFTLGANEKDYTIVCIEGHQYYRANLLNKGFLGIRLDNDGKPVNCN